MSYLHSRSKNQKTSSFFTSRHCRKVRYKAIVEACIVLVDQLFRLECKMTLEIKSIVIDFFLYQIQANCSGVAGSSVRFLVFVTLELGKDSSPKEFRIRFRIALYIKQFRSLTPVGKWAKINFVASSFMIIFVSQCLLAFEFLKAESCSPACCHKKN